MLDSNSDSDHFRSNQTPNMKVAILAHFCFALAVSQDVPDLCQPCIRIFTEADNAAMSACLDKDLVDRQICIEVDATVEETIKLLQSLLAANTDPEEICTLALHDALSDLTIKLLQSLLKANTDPEEIC